MGHLKTGLTVLAALAIYDLVLKDALAKAKASAAAGS